MCLLCAKDGKTSRHPGRQPAPKPVFAPRKKSSGLELVWAAGFFDGEGCTSRQGRYLQISVTQVDNRPLERFLAAVKLGGTTRTRRSGQWRANGQEAYRVMEKLWPHLSEPKREQFLRVEGETW